MKKRKRRIGLILTLVMTLALAMGLRAAELPNQAADLSDHTYKAYQIFKGTQAESGVELGNIQWGSGIRGDAFLAALKSDAVIGYQFTDCLTAADVAGKMSGWADKSDTAKAFASLAVQFTAGDGTAVTEGQTQLEAGYYLVVDTTETNGKYTAKNTALLQLTKKSTFTIENKTDVPEVVKKVKDVNGSTGVESGWQDSADYDIGKKVPYRITGTLPSNYADYKTYKTYTFTDTMSEGLTMPEADSVTIRLNGETDIKAHFEVEISGQTMTIRLKAGEDLKTFAAQASDTIVVEYSAVLNDKAVIGAGGNPNTVKLTYANNPNAGGEGETGTTPEDKNIVFTYQLVVNKVDKENNPLRGAGFTLQKKNAEGSYVDVKTIDAAEATTFTFTGLDNGDYRLIESKTPAGYNTIEPIDFSITADHDTDSDDPKLLTLNGAAGTGNVSLGNQAASVDKAAGTITTNVQNMKGTALPETGGIGTTLFYVLGAVLAVGALVLLAARRRTAK